MHGEVCVNLGTGVASHRYFFMENAAPEIQAWVVVDTSKHEDVENVLRLPADGWRAAELDDITDQGIVMSGGIYNFAESFPTREIAEFCERNDGKIPERLKQVATLLDDEDFGGVREFVNSKVNAINRLVTVPAAAGRIMNRDAADALAEIERRELSALPDEPSLHRAKALAHFCASVQTGEVFAAAIEQLTATLRTVRLPDPELERVLLLCDFRRRYSSSQPPAHFWQGRWQAEREFWEAVSDFYFYPQNVRDVSIDITNATQRRFQSSHHAVKSRRVGNLRPGRPSLYLHNHDRGTYIAGGRRLQVEVANNGGEFRRQGVTLTIGRTADGLLNEMLVEIEQLELLATTNPPEALSRLPREVDPAEPIGVAAVRAQDDYRWGHVLADLLIEELFEIDADVIRRMIRSNRVF